MKLEKVQAYQNHTCYLCGRPILVGEMHYNHRAIGQRWRPHRACEELVRGISMEERRAEVSV